MSREETTSEPKLLADATVEEMARELYRRHPSVLIVIDGKSLDPFDDDYAIPDLVWFGSAAALGALASRAAEHLEEWTRVEGFNEGRIASQPAKPTAADG